MGQLWAVSGEYNGDVGACCDSTTVYHSCWWPGDVRHQGISSHATTQLRESEIRAYFLPLAPSKLRLCSANHRAVYFSNLPCDWPGTVWVFSEQETENRPRSHICLYGRLPPISAVWYICVRLHCLPSNCLSCLWPPIYNCCARSSPPVWQGGCVW